MKLKKLISALLLAVCLFAAICLTGCGKSYTVTLKEMMGGNKNREYTFKVKEGDLISVGIITQYYSDEFYTGFFYDVNLYTDETCFTKFTGNIHEDMTLYYGSYHPVDNIEIIFEYKEKRYRIYRDDDLALAPIDFSRSAYGYGEPTDYAFYSDEERTIPLNLSEVKAPEPICAYREITIYVADAQ